MGTGLMKNRWMENRNRFAEESFDEKYRPLWWMIPWMEDGDRFDEEWENRDRFDEWILGWKIGTLLMKNPWMEYRDGFDEESLESQ